jgi:hypothetical protein
MDRLFSLARCKHCFGTAIALLLKWEGRKSLTYNHLQNFTLLREFEKFTGIENKRNLSKENYNEII